MTISEFSNFCKPSTTHANVESECIKTNEHSTLFAMLHWDGSNSSTNTHYVHCSMPQRNINTNTTIVYGAKHFAIPRLLRPGVQTNVRMSGAKPRLTHTWLRMFMLSCLIEHNSQFLRTAFECDYRLVLGIDDAGSCSRGACGALDSDFVFFCVSFWPCAFKRQHTVDVKKNSSVHLIWWWRIC